MASSSLRVLYVADDSFAEDVAAGLAEHSVDVDTTVSAKTGLERLETEEYDCVISDYRLPDTNGLELLGAVRDTYPALPFVLVPGDGNERVASEAVSAGVTDYLPKDDFEEGFGALADRIREAVDSRRTERLSNRLTAVTDLVWDASEAAFRASSAGTVHRLVCERLADAEPYLLAWIGQLGTDGGTVDPQTSAGLGGRSHEPVSLEDDHEEGDHPAVREAVRTGSIRVERAIRPPDWVETETCRGADGISAAAVPLIHEGESYGVLSVWSDRRYAFEETERRVLSKFGHGVAYAIDSVRTRMELARREQRLQVLNRVLRHNLRNDLNVILGHAENLGDEYPGARAETEAIKQKAGELVRISEKAREVGKTLDADERVDERIDVTGPVERTCAEFRRSHPDVEISLDVPESATVYGDETLDAAIREVIENAIEHNDDRSPASVAVTVSPASRDREWVAVTVADDGPGIPEDEREVLREGEETALHHASGLGLWLTNWIVGRFGGHLAFEDHDSGGSAVTLRLPDGNRSPRKDPPPPD